MNLYMGKWANFESSDFRSSFYGNFRLTKCAEKTEKGKKWKTQL